ncbi:YheC/YheD family protein [Halalkalibacter flavus]|uniref:YheC/YheD family protein n=1 Tax=Halalkalibacter flavus TaxID=3090668 RepID=UPI002FC58EC2
MMAVRLRGRNKYKMYLALKQNNYLESSLPHTMMWSEKNFVSMVRKYKSVVIKPNNGQQGQKIYFVKKIGSKYVVYINKKRKVFKNRKSVSNYMKRVTSKRKFIIQEEVDLARINGKRFDFRIIVQRKERNLPWMVNGMIVRKAGKGYKVTNRRRHGVVMPVEEARKKIHFNEKEIKKVAHLAAETLGHFFPNQKIFGVDIGMKKDGSLYIFELNRWPLLGGFRSLKDKSQINRIMSFKKAARKI